MKDALKTYEHICEGTGCGFYIVWDFGEGDCYSCGKIGESYHVTVYPEDCPYKNEMEKYENTNNPNQDAHRIKS